MGKKHGKKIFDVEGKVIPWCQKYCLSLTPMVSKGGDQETMICKNHIHNTVSTMTIFI